MDASRGLVEATLSAVAREAGVSLATASRVLNGSTRQVRPQLRARVLEAAATLGYTANAAAQAMARGHTDMVGLVVHDITDPYFSAIAAGVSTAAESAGLLVTLACTWGSAEREVAHVAALHGQRARAVVVAGSRSDDTSALERLGEALARFEASGGRCAMVSQRRLPVDTVVCANRAGARALAEALVGLGHRRFGILAGPLHLATVQDRVAGFREGLARAGGIAVPGAVAADAFNRDGGYRALHALHDADGLDLDCLFAVNDLMAVGALSALRERGLLGRIGVAGFDDIATLRDITPRLTTVRLPLEELGAAAMAMAIQPPADTPRRRIVGGEVVLRESTARG